MAYVHCRVRTRIWTPNPMATLDYAEAFNNAQSDSDSNPNCQLQKWDRNSSRYLSLCPAM